MLTGSLNLQKRDLQGGLGADGSTILEWTLEIGINAGNSVDSTQVSDYWGSLVNAALNLRVLGAMELVRLL